MTEDFATKKPVHGRRGRIGLIVPANNSVIEPEMWSVLPRGVAIYATRIMARGALTAAAVRDMETHVDRAAAELAATGVDVIAYCDMVTTFIMEQGWNEAKVAAIAAATGARCVSAWTALKAALDELGVKCFALGTPYPRPVHALAAPFFARSGFTVGGQATLDIVAMRDVPKVDPDALRRFVGTLDKTDAEAVVLLATDLPSFAVLADLEQDCGLPVLTSNQTILWAAMRAIGVDDRLPDLGRLMEI